MSIFVSKVLEIYENGYGSYFPTERDFLLLTNWNVNFQLSKFRKHLKIGIGKGTEIF